MSKGLFSLFFFGMVSVGLSVQACKSDSGKMAGGDYHIAELHEILAAYNADRPDWDKAEKTEGPVKISVEDNMVTIVHDAYNSMEIVTFYLQTDKKVKGLKSGEIEIAEILFMESNMIVNSIVDKQTLHFALNNTANPDFLKSLEGVSTYTGFGLGLRKVNKGSLSANVNNCLCEQAGYPVTRCLSGGTVNLECRIANESGSCRVTCSGQTYACCGF